MASDFWAQGDPYERYVGRWSRKVAPQFVDWLDLPPGLRWLDVGCGTGALCGAILEHGSPAAVTGVEPSAGFLATATERLGHAATLLPGEASAIPLDAACVDVVVSGLVLNFVPDPSRALEEMKRVSVAGGTIACYVWDYAKGMELMRHFWDVAVELDPRGRAIDESARFPQCSPGPLAQLFTAADLRDVAVDAIDTPTPFRDFDDYWQPFLGGQGPAPAYAMSLGEAARDRLRERIRARLPIASDGSIALTARAWAVRGVVGPKSSAERPSRDAPGRGALS